MQIFISRRLCFGSLLSYYVYLRKWVVIINTEGSDRKRTKSQHILSSDCDECKPALTKIEWEKHLNFMGTNFKRILGNQMV